MATQKIDRNMLNTGIVDNSNATAITIDSSENVTFAGAITLPSSAQLNASGALYLDSDITHFRLNNETEIARINTTGLAIGTTAVGALLHVSNGATNNLANNTSEVRFIGADKAITGEQANLVIQTNDDMAVDKGGSIGFGGRAKSSSTDSNNFAHISGRKENSTTSNFAGYLSFGTSDSASDIHERMRITSTGNVGIGTSSPAFPLHINSSSTDVAKFQTSGSYTYTRFQNSSKTWALSVGSGFGFYDEAASATRMLIDSSGNVGIGTTSPTGAGKILHFNSSSNVADFHITNSVTGTASTDGFILRVTDPANVEYVNREATHQIFYQAGSEKLRIQSGGGISFNGDTAAANALDDYEEGTWTPACGATLSTASGQYTKIGNQVTVHYHIVSTGGLPGSGGQVIITGLPFTSNSGSLTAAPIYARYYSPNDSTLTSLVQDGESQIRLINTNDSSFDYTVWGELEGGGANNSIYIIGSATYIV